MKVLRFKIICVILAAVFVIASPTYALRMHGSIPATPAIIAGSQLNPDSPGEYLTLNMLKEAQFWTNGDFTHPGPADLDTNGYPLYGSSIFTSHGGTFTVLIAPSQAERSGNYVVIATGSGQLFAYDGNGSSTGAACTGTQSLSGNIACNNSGCSAATGSITGTTLTITGASSCNLVLYQPISNGSTTVNMFGVPTMIVGNATTGSGLCSPSCTGTGGTGTYAVNWSQAVGSGPINPGIYNEIVAGAETATGNTQWTLGIQAVTSGNTFGNMAFVYKGDLALYASGQVTGVQYKLRAQQAKFAVLRDLDTAATNATNVTTWATRKPASYWSYVATEMRSSLYTSALTYALNGSSNDYAVTFGSGGPVDKQTICVQWPTNATNTTITFNLNSTSKVPVYDYHASGPQGNLPIAGQYAGLTYDVSLNTWQSTEPIGNGQACLINGMPPEAFVKINSEIGANPWIVEPYMASDPITDYPIQYALYIKANYPSMVPQFEIGDELWNYAGQGLGCYAASKSRAYIAVDAAWAANASGHLYCGGGGDINNWAGKVGSLLGQAIHSVSNSFPVISGVGTNVYTAAGSVWNADLLSTSYVNQSAADIPTQSGCAGPAAIQTDCPAPFTKTPAYQHISDIAIANYWVTQTYKNGTTEVASAWCYFYQGSGCASQSSIMSAYMSNNNITSNPNAFTTNWPAWYAFAQSCAGGSGCTPLTIRNYEGTYTSGGQGSDITASITGATNTSPAVLTVAGNGAFVGMTVSILSPSGGTWSTIAGNNYTVTAVGANTITINLNSTSLGTLSSATLDYVGSANYITYFSANSYLTPQLATLTEQAYNTIASTSGACSPNACSISPSQFNMSGQWAGTGSDTWLTWAFDTYGYFPVANCTACTISGSNLTLGGTATGIFTPGLTVLWGTTTPPTITGACSQTGAGPAGSNVGDICPLSASFTVSSGTAMSGNATPQLNGLGNSTTSPVKQWLGICTWNGNASAC